MIDVRPARGDDEVRAALRLRHDVFVVEQHVPLADELDGRDDEALHLVAVDASGAVVATCRLLGGGSTVTLGRMAVAAAARRRGLASRLLAEAEAQARARGAAGIVLAAQTAALELYERAGYTRRGDMFLDAGIEHVMMEKRLRAA
jgi:predicted GNAT family N-acyltransferase